MAIKLFIGEKYRWEHERRAFGPFLEEMSDRYGPADDPIYLVVEPQINMAAVDLLVIKRRALVLVDFKELTRVPPDQAAQVILEGKENGPWTYRLPGEEPIYVGEYGEKNPYRQLKRFSDQFSEWLADHSASLPGTGWSKREALRTIADWVAVSPGFDPTGSHFDLPRAALGDWFRVLPIAQLAYELGLVTRANLELEPDDMDRLIDALGVEECEHLQEFIPTYVPRVAHVPFFSHPRIARNLIGREAERARLSEFLEDPSTPVLSLGGPRGVGKTELAAWLCQQAQARGRQTWWVSCGEKEVTIESLTSALAVDMPDREQAAFVADPERKPADRFDALLTFLDSQKALLILDDFHEVALDEHLEQLLTRIVHRAVSTKVVLVTRRRPKLLDLPDWSPGSAVEIELDGFGFEDLVRFIEAHRVPKRLSEAQLRVILERTSGNPYAIGSILAMMRASGWSADPATLPLYEPGKIDEWAQSNLRILGDQAKSLAYRLAVVRGGLDQDLVEALCQAGEDPRALIVELTDKYILKESRPGEYALHAFIREYLDSRAVPKSRAKAHAKVAQHFAGLAGQVEGRRERVECLVEATNHFAAAEEWGDLLKIAKPAYDALLSTGDPDRAMTVAGHALQAAEAKAPLEAPHWLLNLVKREIDTRQTSQARGHLETAFRALEDPKKKIPAREKARRQALRGELLIQQARLEQMSRAIQDPAERSRRIDQLFEEGLGLVREHADARSKAYCIWRIGEIERHRGRFEQAQPLLVEAGTFARSAGDARLLAMCVSQLGMIARSNGDLDAAEALFEEAFEICLEDDNMMGAEISEGLLGDVALKTGDFARAEGIFRKQLETARRIGNSLGVRIGMGRLAEALIGRRCGDEAEGLLAELEEMTREAGDVIGLAWTFRRQGQLEHARGKIKAGNRLIRAGIAKLEEIGRMDYILDFEQVLKPEDD